MNEPTERDIAEMAEAFDQMSAERFMRQNPERAERILNNIKGGRHGKK